MDDPHESIPVTSDFEATVICRAVDYYSKHIEITPAARMYDRFADRRTDDFPTEFHVASKEELETLRQALSEFDENRSLASDFEDALETQLEHVSR